MSEKIVSDEIFALICEKLSKGGIVSLTVTGNSMHPFFHDREDTVELCPLTGPAKKNDVVFYIRNDGTYVLHRVIRIAKGVLYCRGDNQFSRPEDVDPGSVIGVVRSYTSRGKTYGMRSFRSLFVLSYVKVFFFFRRLCRKLSKNNTV